MSEYTIAAIKQEWGRCSSTMQKALIRHYLEKYGTGTKKWMEYLRDQLLIDACEFSPYWPEGWVIPDSAYTESSHQYRYRKLDRQAPG